VRNSALIIIHSIQRQNVLSFRIICALFLKKVNAISICGLSVVKVSHLASAEEEYGMIFKCHFMKASKNILQEF
jgi:hypothetical protein